ncbi:hydrolase [Planctomicrobium piriforme]|uniref:Isochorismate hydrolase n=1 Tax=Planctomicrobium piriforme TaxID=1576369 RepID=A0A1I3NAH6_9PLAN|nr:hydrolase [Planctomicrobium piriforme]SFJ05970.1 Isochorismate hydrolase [Planctomicrobium piriforme]
MTEPGYHRSPELLNAGTSRLVIVDVQEKLLPVIPESEAVVANCIKLVKGSALLQVPCSITEQYPRGLGPTTAAVAELTTERSEKLRFSAAEAMSWAREAGTDDGRQQIVLAGIETHVCVLQTAFDLLAAGFDVFVVADAVHSRRPLDHEVALKRMADSGARIITTEMALFEWCEVAGNDQFKQISRLVTGR